MGEGLHLCVHVSMCVYKGVNLGKDGWEKKGEARAREEDVGINSSPFIEFIRRAKKGLCFFFFLLLLIACGDLVFKHNYCIKYRVPFDLHVIAAFSKCQLFRWGGKI